MTLPVFPTLTGVDWDIERKVLWATNRYVSVSGLRTSNPLRTLPTRSWKIRIPILRSGVFGGQTLAEMESLTGLYNTCCGAAYPFSYKDDADCSALLQVFGTGNGSTKTFQLCRSVGGFTEPVYLIGSPISVYKNGVLQSGASYTVGVTGIVTFNTAPASGVVLTWSGSYTWLCRFDDDSLETVQMMPGRYSVSSVSFTSELL